MRFKSWITTALRQRGYFFGKYPAVDFEPLPVFHILVQQLMAVRGQRLSVIQIGANDGRGFGDPLTKYLDNYPWRAVLVEPQPDVCAVLRKTYASASSHIVIEIVAISSNTDTLVMYRQRNASPAADNQSSYASSVVSADRSVIRRQLGVRQEEIEQFEVPCTTIDSLVHKHQMDDCDLLQVDTEGHERIVLDTLSFESCRPRMIQFEHGHLRPHDITAVFARLARHGYRVLYGGRQIDSVACHHTALTEMGVQ